MKIRVSKGGFQMNHMKYKKGVYKNEVCSATCELGCMPCR